MKKEKLFELFGDINENYISDAHGTQSKKSRPVWIRLGAAVACIALLLVVCSAPLWNEQPIDNPLIIKAYAVGVNNQEFATNLSLGERIQLSPTEFYFEGDYEYFSFDLSLMDGLYLQLSSVDENWELILDKEIHYSDEETVPPYWALTEGNEIAIISTDLQGNVFQAYKDGSEQPRMKGSAMIWRVNNDGVNRCIIECFDNDFNRIVSYHLEITESNGLYYAEIVKIV